MLFLYNSMLFLRKSMFSIGNVCFTDRKHVPPIEKQTLLCGKHVLPMEKHTPMKNMVFLRNSMLFHRKKMLFHRKNMLIEKCHFL